MKSFLGEDLGEDLGEEAGEEGEEPLLSLNVPGLLYPALLLLYQIWLFKAFSRCMGDPIFLTTFRLCASSYILIELCAASTASPLRYFTYQLGAKNTFYLVMHHPVIS